MKPTSRLHEDLEALGIRRGDNLLIHSAFSSLRREVTPREFIDTVREVIDGGTLLLPTLSWANVTAASPVFDVNKTPCCTGFLPEYFRTAYPDVRRSLHPTHSCCAVGGEAGWFVEGHELDSTPVGKNSPFSKLREVKGKILFLGCGAEPNTSMHGVEELANPPYLYGSPLKYTLTGYDGKTYDKIYTPHGFADTYQHYERLEKLMPVHAVSHGRLLYADTIVMAADAVWTTALDKMKTNPLYFVTMRRNSKAHT